MFKLWNETSGFIPTSIFFSILFFGGRFIFFFSMNEFHSNKPCSCTRSIISLWFWSRCLLDISPISSVERKLCSSPHSALSLPMPFSFFLVSFHGSHSPNFSWPLVMPRTQAPITLSTMTRSKRLIVKPSSQCERRASTPGNFHLLQPQR